MLKSIQLLFKHPYNKANITFALTRLIVWKFVKLLKLKNITFPIWNNKKILLNHDSLQCMWIMYNYIVDWEEFVFVKRFVKTDDQVCDVGANMGFYTIWMSKFISKGLIHSFEPDDKNFDRLNKNVNLNQINTIVKLNKCLLSEINGNLNFTVGLDGENHISIKGNQQVVVKISKSLDLYAEENKINHFAYVKIDTEGFELAVLKGSKNLLSENKISVIQLEINNTVQNSSTDIYSLLNFLKIHNYQLCSYDVAKNQLVKIEYFSARENYFATIDIENINQRLKTND